ncbi:MAG TPA: hypothetical protein VMA36_12315 [Candidatus Limnocylindria bacterium]|jgi:hypothetical protein|nr:hypothetical protein [Candidatus Limnocylindria bacterium]
MTRPLVFGGVALAASLALGRQFASIGKDLAHYDRLNAMSDEPPLLVTMLRHALRALRVRSGLLRSIRSDALRYARMRSM